MIRWKSIDIVPTVIVLCLLVFVLALLHASQLPAYSILWVKALPHTSRDFTGKGKSSKFVVVSIDKARNVYVDGEPVRCGGLGDGLKAAFAERPVDRKRVMIKASSRLAYGDVAKVIDEIKGAGATQVILQLEHLDNP